MVAFHLFGWPIYRYGIGYAITFIVGYWRLGWVASTQVMTKYTHLKRFLEQHRDDLFLAIVLWVIVGWRVGEIFLYAPSYYRTHPEALAAVRQWGMSFVGGIIGVIIALILVMWRYKLSRRDMRVLWDIVVCIVPLGSLLWRISNMLNQELYGLPIDRLPVRRAEVLTKLHLTYVYTQIDEQLRVNTNIIQSILEWALIRIVLLVLFQKYRRKGRWAEGKLGAVFLMLYGIMRFGAEFFKDLPVNEQLGVISISQVLSIILIGVGGYVFRTFGKNERH